METRKVYYCYKAVNDVNGKIYIGFAVDPKKRWRQHKADAINGRGYVFHDAIRKHGWHHFHFEIICCGLNKREMLEFIEPALIEQYQSNIGQNGYNMQHKVIGASGRDIDKRGKRTPEQKERMSQASKKRVADPLMREQISNSLKEYFKSIGGSPKKGMIFVEPKPPKVPQYTSDQNLKEYFNTYFMIKNGKINPTYCRIENLIKRNVWDSLLERTSFLDEDCMVAERIFVVRNDLFAIPICLFCENKVKYSRSVRWKETSGGGYLRTCSHKCGRLDALNKESLNKQQNQTSMV